MHQNFDELPFFFFCTSEDGIIQQINLPLCRKLGYEKQDLLGKNQDIIFTMATRIFQQTHLFPLLKIKESAEEILITLQARDRKQVAALFNISQHAAGSNSHTNYTGIQIAQRKEYEDRLLAEKKAAEVALSENNALIEVKKQLQEKMEQLDMHMAIVKRQAYGLSQFNKAVTHDLEEPLRKLSVFSGILAQNETADNIPAITAKMMQAAVKTKTVVSGLQEYVWLAAAVLTPTAINFDLIIDAAVIKLKKEYPGIELIITKQEIPSFYGDADQLLLLTYQLIANAIRFRLPGNSAHVHVSANLLKLNKFRNLENKYNYADHIRFEFKDEGIGFNGTFAEQAFDLFRTLHPNSGNGIGLALCRRVIDNHGGTISLSSSQNKGTMVSFTLPVNVYLLNLSNDESLR